MALNFHPDLESIHREFQEKAKAFEGPLTPEREKEILKQVVAEKLRIQPQGVSAQAPASAQQIAKTQKDDQRRVEYQEVISSLVETVFTQGLDEAVKQARQTHNAFLIDAFHDELVDRFYQEIKSQEK
jgi:hypothetical protein